MKNWERKKRQSQKIKEKNFLAPSLLTVSSDQLISFSFFRSFSSRNSLLSFFLSFILLFFSSLFFLFSLSLSFIMHLMRCDHCSVYTIQKQCTCGNPTRSAHPARFSPDDKFSKERVTLKKRFGLLPTQQPPVKY